ncbi:hypothetical protein [Paenibacillus nasutitermitis]|uniref:Uncharacterized protein n=1 Tax=Paenibacillus nasutitermitis TaxID=1652958 RepID=A0A916Z436_9BACL|nr:hypothetical protein [Paenibacillus nasutitermitis]GGD75052.1 hypothetical protein GCM10010911_36210 [Paenibacillus nasutitermitis]
MLSRCISVKRWFSLLFLVIFTVFSMPTTISESVPGETTRTVVSAGMENKTSRISVSQHHVTLLEKLRLASLVSALFFAVILFRKYAIRTLLDTHVSFYPLISRCLTRLLLTPIQKTSLFV